MSDSRLRIDPELLKRAKAAAALRGITLTTFVADALKYWAGRTSKERTKP